MKKTNQRDTITKLLDNHNVFAVVGVSKNENKYGNKVYKDLKSAGYRVYPVNPKETEILGDQCYKDLYHLPEKPDVVNIVTPPEVTKRIVQDCKKIGIDKIWLQPGAESDEIIAYCKKNSMLCVHDVCVMMQKKDSN